MHSISNIRLKTRAISFSFFFARAGRGPDSSRFRRLIFIDTKFQKEPERDRSGTCLLASAKPTSLVETLDSADQRTPFLGCKRSKVMILNLLVWRRALLGFHHALPLIVAIGA